MAAQNKQVTATEITQIMSICSKKGETWALKSTTYKPKSTRCQVAPATLILLVTTCTKWVQIVKQAS